MKSYTFGVGTGPENTVHADNHGYRTKFYSPAFGYIGSYFPATKKVGYSAPGKGEWSCSAKGPKNAAYICLKKAWHW